MNQIGSVHLSCPYKGLVPYDEQDAPYFFGREAEQEIITSNLLGSRLTLFYGASGVGKSSVLRAGVAHHVRKLASRDAAPGAAPEFALVIFRAWSGDPVAGLLSRVEEGVRDALGLQSPAPVSSSDRLAEALGARSQNFPGGLLIILDQFEEYFLYHPSEDGPGCFAVELPRAVNAPDLRVNFLISIREDALARLDRFKGRIPNLFDNFLRINHLRRDAARQAIIQPLKIFAARPESEGKPVGIEPELVEEVLDQVGAGKVVLGPTGRGESSTAVAGAPEITDRIETPYLQLVLTRLWDAEVKAGSRLLRLQTLLDLGDAEIIVRRHLDEVLSRLAPKDHKVAAAVLDYLVTPSGGKIAQSAETLASWTDTPAAQVETILDRLCEQDCRILRPVRIAGEACHYEIYHDVLGKAIVDYVAKYEANLAHERRRQEDFRQQVEDRRREREALARKYQKRLTLSLVAGLAISLIFAFAAAHQRQQAVAQREMAEEASRIATEQARLADQKTKLAEEEKKRATEENDKFKHQLGVSLSRKLAASAIGLINQRLDLALLLSQEAMKASKGEPTFEARSSLFRAVMASPHLRAYLQGPRDVILAMRFAADGRTLSALAGDSSLRRWDLAGDDPPRAPSAPLALSTEGESRQDLGMLSNASFGADGAVAALMFDTPTRQFVPRREIRLWDLSPGAGRIKGEIPALLGYRSLSVTLSPNGKTLAIWGAKGDTKGATETLAPKETLVPSVILWDVAAGKPRDGVIDIWSSGVATAAVFSPDGTTLAVGSDRGEIKLWEVATGKSLSPLADAREGTTIHRVSFRRDQQPSLPTSPIQSLAFSPDGKLLASGNESDWIVLWDVAVRKSYRTIGGSSRQDYPSPGTKPPSDAGKSAGESSGGVTCLAYSPDGRILASGHGDRSIRLWDAATDRPLDRPLIGHSSPITSLAFHPDGRSLASGSRSGECILWTVRLTGQLEQAGEFGSFRGGLAFSPDGRILAAGYNYDVMLWDVARRAPLMSKPSPMGDDTLWCVAFSPDGRTLAAGYGSMGSPPGYAVLWDVARRARLGSELLKVPEGSVYGVAFSPDGKTLATVYMRGGGSDRGVVLWDITSRKRLAEDPLQARVGDIYSIAFSPDGKTLAAGYSARGYLVTGGGVVLWDIASRRPLGDQPLAVKEGNVYSVAFSPDGKTLAAGNGEYGGGGVVLWDLATRQRLVGKPLAVPEGEVFSVSFSPDGTILASGSRDGSLILWDLAARQPLSRITSASAVNAVAFSPDGTSLASASQGGGVVLWDPRVESLLSQASRLANRELTAAERNQYVETESTPELPPINPPAPPNLPFQSSEIKRH